MAGDRHTRTDEARSDLCRILSLQINKRNPDNLSFPAESPVEFLPLVFADKRPQQRATLARFSRFPKRRQRLLSPKVLERKPCSPRMSGTRL